VGGALKSWSNLVLSHEASLFEYLQGQGSGDRVNEDELAQMNVGLRCLTLFALMENWAADTHIIVGKDFRVRSLAQKAICAAQQTVPIDH